MTFATVACTIVVTASVYHSPDGVPSAIRLSAQPQRNCPKVTVQLATRLYGKTRPEQLFCVRTRERPVLRWPSVVGLPVPGRTYSRPLGR